MGKGWWIAGIVAVVAVGIQFVPVKRTNPPVRHDVAAPAEVAALLRGACYDCHSYETRWPWYSRVAPFSWQITHHVVEGRRELNFSDWPVVDFDAQDLLLREIVDELRDGAMPPRSYRLAHAEARLTPEQVDSVLAWARGE
jgi:hypothetical protein